MPGTYTARLTVSNGLESSTATRTIEVTTPPGPIADFTLDPSTGAAPLQVSITDASTGTIASYAWDLDGDGTIDSTQQDPPQQTYPAGTWNVSLTVDDGTGQTSTTTKQVVATPPILQCTVPDFKNQDTSNNIQQQWTTAGFQTTVIFNPSRPPEFKITKQSLTKGSRRPCATAVITVFDH